MWCLELNVSEWARHDWKSFILDHLHSIHLFMNKTSVKSEYFKIWKTQTVSLVLNNKAVCRRSLCLVNVSPCGWLQKRLGAQSAPSVLSRGYYCSVMMCFYSVSLIPKGRSPRSQHCCLLVHFSRNASTRTAQTQTGTDTDM